MVFLCSSASSMCTQYVGILQSCISICRSFFSSSYSCCLMSSDETEDKDTVAVENPADLLAPFVCSVCKYVWDTPTRFTAHLKYCHISNSFVGRRFFLRHIRDQAAFFFDEEKFVKGDIPSDRCNCRLRNGLRKNRFCLRNSSDKNHRCGYHSHIPQSQPTSPLQIQQGGGSSSSSDDIADVTERFGYTKLQ